MSSAVSRPRALVPALLLAVTFTTGGAVATDSAVASAAPCVRFVKSNFDAPGDDNYMPQLNYEWVRIKNTCATKKNIGAWTIHDYRKYHVYRFPSTFYIASGATITLRSGKGTNTSTTRYWQRSYGAVWNNAPTEYAYLRNRSGTLVNRWTEY